MTTTQKNMVVVSDTVFSSDGIVEFFSYIINGISFTGESLGLPKTQVLNKGGIKTPTGERKEKHSRSTTLFKVNGVLQGSNPLFESKGQTFISLGALAHFLKACVIIVGEQVFLKAFEKDYTLKEVKNIGGVMMVNVTSPEIQTTLGLEYNEKHLCYNLN